MASNAALPTIRELMDAFSVGAISKHEGADTHDFANYSALAGMGSLMWSRVAVRDREVFRAIYLDSVVGDALEYRIKAFGGPERVKQSRGVGAVVLAWDVDSNGSALGMFLKGTRIAAIAGDSVRYYRLAQDTTVSAAFFANGSGQYRYISLSIEAELAGSGVAVDSLKMPIVLHWEDIPYNTDWQILSLKCGDGLPGEKDTEYRARYREWLRLRKTGLAATVSRAMLSAGAQKVAIFESDVFGSTDYGINRIFVDLPFATDKFNACKLALDSCVPFGCTTTLGTMTPAHLNIEVVLKVAVDPSKFNPGLIQLSAQQAVQRAIRGSQSAYVFRRDAIRSELFRSIPHLQSVEFDSNTPADTDANAIVSTGCNDALVVYDSNNVTVRATLEGP